MLPQMIFLNCLFGYLSICIIYKWVSGATTDLYHVMINMFLSPGTVDETGYLYAGQSGLQVSCAPRLQAVLYVLEKHDRLGAIANIDSHGALCGLRVQRWTLLGVNVSCQL